MIVKTINTVCQRYGHNWVLTSFSVLVVMLCIFYSCPAYADTGTNQPIAEQSIAQYYQLHSGFKSTYSLSVENETEIKIDEPPPILMQVEAVDESSGLEGGRIGKRSPLYQPTVDLQIDSGFFSNEIIGRCYDGQLNGLDLNTANYTSDLYRVFINGIRVAENARFLKRPCGSLLAELQDFYNWRLIIKDQLNVQIDGINYLSLLAYPTLTYTVNSQKRSVDIRVSPQRFAPVVVDFDNQFEDVDDAALGAFLNYGASVSYNHNSDSYFAAGNAELGITHDWGVLTTDWIITYIDETSDTNIDRFNSQLRIDFPSQASTLRIGDVLSRGEWARGYQLGGFNFGNTYESQPQYNTSVVHDITVYSDEIARLRLESDPVEVFEDRGAFLFYEPLLEFRPGTVTFADIPGSGTGEFALEVSREKDGATYIYKQPYFYNSGLVRTTLHRYNFSVGLERQGFLSERYENLVVSATDYFGVNNYLTTGVHVDYNDRKWVYGLEALTSIPYVGVLSGLAAAGHRDSELTKESMRYRLQLRNSYSNLFYSAFYNYLGQRHLVTVTSDELPDNDLKHSYGGNVAFPIDGLSRRINLNYNAQRSRDGAFRDRYRLGFNVQVGGANVNLGYTYQVHPDSDWGAFASLSMSFETIRRSLEIVPERSKRDGKLFTWDGSRLNVGVSRRKDGDFRGNMSLSTRATLDDENYGLNLSRPLFDDQDIYRLSGQYSNRYITSTASTRIVDGDLSTSTIGFNSSLVLLDNSLYATKSVTNSFAVIKLGEDGAGVRVNGFEADDDGNVFIPRLSSYSNNLLNISQNDVPLSADIADLKREVRPGFRKALIIDFEIIAPVSALINVNLLRRGEYIPLPYDSQVRLDDRPDSIPVGDDGLVYLTDIVDGSVVRIRYKNINCDITLELPDDFDKEDILELGNYNCDGT